MFNARAVLECAFSREFSKVASFLFFFSFFGLLQTIAQLFHATDVIFMNSRHHCSTPNRRQKCVRSMRVVSFVVFSDVMKNPVPRCLHFIFGSWQVWQLAKITCLQLITCLDVFSWCKSREVECKKSFFCMFSRSMDGLAHPFGGDSLQMNEFPVLFVSVLYESTMHIYLPQSSPFFSARSQFQSNLCFLGGNNLKFRVLIGDVISRYVRYGLSYTATKQCYRLFSHTDLNTCTASLLSFICAF